MSTVLILVGFVALLVAAVGIIRGGVQRVGLTGRKQSAVALAGALFVMIVGGALAPNPASTTEAEQVATTRSAPVAESSPEATAEPAAQASPAAEPVETVVPTDAPASTADVIGNADSGSALALLGTLAVKGRAPKTGYSRDEFGAAWTDTDRNGCDTRNDILERDLTGETFRAGTNGCVVIAGTLAEPYTGQTMTFAKSDASAVQIDHVVSLSDAWQTGAQSWPAGKRLAFANDPLNLLAVDGPSNASKSDSDAASWLPPNKSYRCPMVARQTAVKAKYGLWVKPAERDAIARVLSACPQQLAPTGGNPTMAPVAPAPRQPAAAPAPEQSSAPTKTSAPAPKPAAAKTYANCTEMHQDYKGGVARPGAVDKRSSGQSEVRAVLQPGTV